MKVNKMHENLQFYEAKVIDPLELKTSPTVNGMDALANSILTRCLDVDPDIERSISIRSEKCSFCFFRPVFSDFSIMFQSFPVFFLTFARSTVPRNTAMSNPICALKSQLGAIRVEIQAMNRCIKRGGTSK